MVKGEKAEGLIFDFWVFSGIVCMRELQGSPVIDIDHESDIRFYLSDGSIKLDLISCSSFELIF